MTSNVSFETKELKSILKTYGKFASQNFRNSYPAVVVSPPVAENQKTQLILSTDHAYVTSTPESQYSGDNPQAFAMNSDRLLQLSLSGKQTSLSWVNERSPLQVKDGKISASLNVAVVMPEFKHLPEHVETVTIPTALMSSLQHYADVPFSYFSTSNKESNPVRLLKNQAGNLEVHTDDSYSLIKLETDYQVSKDMGFKLPKYVFDALYAGRDDEETQSVIGNNGFSIYAANHNIQSVVAGLNDDTSNFDSVYEAVGNNWLTSCTFSPKTLLESIRPLVSVLPKKDTVGAIINMSFKDDRVVMSIKHKEVGEVLVENVDGVSNVYNEKSIRNVVLNLHPQAFLDYTTLLKDVEEVRMFANNQLVYYEASKTVLSHKILIKYLFPTVQV